MSGNNEMTSVPSVESLLEFFKALASEKRQEILFQVFADRKEHTVGDVAKRMAIAPSTASEHLSMLKRVGILKSVKRDKEVFYSPDRKKVLETLDYIKQHLSCCD